jgi:hypothetical protein
MEGKLMALNNKRKQKANPTLKAGIICVLAIAIIWAIMTYYHVW